MIIPYYNIPYQNITRLSKMPFWFQFHIIGEKGSSFLSDIGLDDFSYTDGDCPGMHSYGILCILIIY